MKMKGFDAAFLDDTPLPTKFRPPNLRYAYRAIDSVRRINFQSGMRSYLAEQSLRSASAKSSRTSMFPLSSGCSDGFPESSAPSSQVHSPEGSLSSSSTQLALTTKGNTSTAAVTFALAPPTARSVPVSRAVSSCDLLEQLRVRTQSNESLVKQKEILEKQFRELEHELNKALGSSGTGGKELQALKFEIEDVKSKIGCETKFLSLVVKALEGAVRKLSRCSLNDNNLPDDLSRSFNDSPRESTIRPSPAMTRNNRMLPISAPSRSLDGAQLRAGLNPARSNLETKTSLALSTSSCNFQEAEQQHAALME